MVELRILVHILPDLLVRRMENMGSVFVNIDVIPARRIDIASDVIALVNHNRRPASLAGFICKDRAVQAGPDHQIVENLSGLDLLPVLPLLLCVRVHLLLVLQIRSADRLRVPLHHDIALVKPQDMVTEPDDRRNIMGHIQKRRAAGKHLLHARIAASSEVRIPDRQHLIADQDLRIDHRRDRESQASLHSGGIILDRGVQEALKLRELDNLIKMLLHEFSRMPEHRPIQEDVLPRRQLLVEACAELDHRCNFPPDLDRSLVRLQDACDHLEQRTLAGTICPDQPPGLPPLHMKIHILQRQELLEGQLIPNLPDRKFLQIVDLDVSEVKADRRMIHIDDILSHRISPFLPVYPVSGGWQSVPAALRPVIRFGAVQM